MHAFEAAPRLQALPCTCGGTAVPPKGRSPSILLSEPQEEPDLDGMGGNLLDPEQLGFHDDVPEASVEYPEVLGLTDFQSAWDEEARGEPDLASPRGAGEGVPVHAGGTEGPGLHKIKGGHVVSDEEEDVRDILIREGLTAAQRAEEAEDSLDRQRGSGPGEDGEGGSDAFIAEAGTGTKAAAEPEQDGPGVFGGILKSKQTSADDSAHREEAGPSSKKGSSGLDEMSLMEKSAHLLRGVQGA